MTRETAELAAIIIDRVDKRLPTYVDVNREPKWLQVLRNITGNDKSLI